jgi:ribosomal protein S3AE
MRTDRRVHKGLNSRTDRALERRTVMTKLLDISNNYTNSPEMRCILFRIISVTAEVRNTSTRYIQHYVVTVEELTIHTTLNCVLLPWNR